MGQKVHLNGGPMHDKFVSVPEGHDHIHIGGMKPISREELASSEPVEVEMRKGTYSQVTGVEGEYEWDGWVSHA